MWANVPKSHEADILVSLSENCVGEENVFIFTKPIRDGECYAGKFDWVEKHFPSYVDRLIIGSHKEIAANRESLLIDDNEDNVNRFLGEGGVAFLIPRPWNRLCHIVRNENVKHIYTLFNYINTRS
jgi:5'(3')-deoxyribonucleotidase